MTHAAILGLGTAIPATSIAQDAAADLARFISAPTSAPTAETDRLLPILYRRTTVRRRGSVLLDNPSSTPKPVQSFFSPATGPNDLGPGTAARLDRYALEAPRLATQAAAAAMSNASLNPQQITHIITVSCTGFMAPGLDAALINALHLSPQTQRTHIGFMGCHGAINGLRIATALAIADPAAHILVVAVELCSLHFHYGFNPEHMVANALFADGAAAIIVGQRTSTPHPALRLSSFGSCIIPGSEHAMTWRIGDHGFTMTLSSRVPDLLHAHLRAWLDPWLDKSGLSPRDIRGWAIHPGGPRIIDTVEQVLQLPQSASDASRAILAAHGNMSSPTILFILAELIRRDQPRPYLALGFGPGLVAEAMLIH